jgi:serine/threonine protein kinase
MEGGSLLGQGSYGCVFTPPLLCSKKTQKAPKGVVGKISAPVDAMSELEAAKILTNLKGSYFILPNIKSVCEPLALSKQPDTKSIEGCDFIKTGDDVVQFTMPYGGIAIDKAMKLQKTPIEIIPFTRQLLEAGAQLALHGLVHYDIHEGNILLDPKTKLPVIIDFGMSFSANTITNQVLSMRWKANANDWNPEQPEISLISSIRKGQAIPEILRDILKVKPVFREAESVLGLSRRSQLQKLTQFSRSSKSIREENWVKFFEYYWSTLDAWQIGIILLKLIRIMNLTGGKTGALKDLVRGLLCADPRERLDCIEALSIFDPDNSIINTSAGKKWRADRQAIRDAIKSDSR